jgi:tetratricopeptide (TPR) repeat protein
MKYRWVIGAVAVGLLAGSAGQAFDTVKMTTKPMPGRVVSVSAEKVDLEQLNTAKLVKEIPVNQVLNVHYDEDPTDLTNAKKAIIEARYTDALAALQRIKKEPDRAEVKQDIAFYPALCAAKLALSGSGKVADAGRMMKAFADANPNSYHYFEASELVGDLLVAVGQYAPAADYYARLAKAPWPDYQMRAQVATGRAMLAQGKTAEATIAFDRAIAIEGAGDLAESQRMLATLGKAGISWILKKPDEAIKIAEDVLRRAEPDNAAVRAPAYNVIGTAHRQAGRTQEALLAFLHIDLDDALSAVPSAHAEALANLAELWEQVHKGERAIRARKTLEELYKDSPWYKKVQQP